MLEAIQALGLNDWMIIFGFTAWVFLAAGWCAVSFWVVPGLWRRLTRAYHFTVIPYWLDRIEKGGWREFQKAEQEAKSKGKKP
jgi:hypothetical protein